MKAKRLLFLVMAVMGVGGLIGGVFYTLDQINFLNRAVQTRAVIVDTFWDFDDDAEFPVFQFVDLNGVECTARGYVGGIYSASDIGREVDIYYDPENPTYVVASNFLGIWTGSIALLGFGFFFTLVGGLFFLKFDG